VHNKALVFPREKGYIPSMAEMEAYCVKCRAKRLMKDGKEITIPGKGGERRAIRVFARHAAQKCLESLGRREISEIFRFPF